MTTLIAMIPTMDIVIPTIAMICIILIELLKVQVITTVITVNSFEFMNILE